MRRHRPLQLAGLLALAASAWTGVLSSSALALPAGEYQVEACTAAVGYANNTWADIINNTTYLEMHTTCGEASASAKTSTLANLEIGDVIGLSKSPTVGVGGEWSFTAVAGTTIVEVRGEDSLYRSGRSWEVYWATENANGEETTQESCSAVTERECAFGGPFQATALQARTIRFVALCTAEEYAPGQYFTTCPGGALYHDVHVGIRDAIVTLEDRTPPSEVQLDGPPSGAQRGTITLKASAEDPVAGLLSLAIIDEDGNTVAGPVSAGACNYSELTPCPTSVVELPLELDTTNLAEGEQALRAQATNAAHDQASSQPFTIDVENKSTTTETTTTTTTTTTASNGSTEGGSGQTEEHHATTTTTTITEPAITTTSTTTATKHPGEHPQTIKLTKARIAKGWLTLAGTLTSRQVTPLQLRATAPRRSHIATWRRKVRTTARHGRFTLRLRVPAQLKHRTLTLSLLAPAHNDYKRATLTRRLFDD
jgi:hypothetical protein